jgi:anti-sigma B factor antagonist
MRRVVVEGELDLRTAPQLEAVLDRAIERGQGLLLDLSRVQFIDSTSLHTILLALERSRFADSRLAICADLPDHARRLFELVGVLEQLPLED